VHVHAKVHAHDGEHWAHLQVIKGMIRRLGNVAACRSLLLPLLHCDV
jgi:hypothetical protein